MKKFFLSLCFLFCFSIFCFAQGTLKGKIIDEHGETVVGATILIKGTTIGVTTDLDGNYSLKIPDESKKTIVISFISYKTIEFQVTAKNNETQVRDFKLENDTKDLGTIEVVGKSSRAKEYYMENMKMNSSVSLDYISAQTMQKTGDANISAAVARVSGVSTNSGGLITVRGAGDRFIKTNLNGARIPTLDPLTNNIKLDMFPAGLVDNVVLVKTASPDLPGDWAAAYLSVETKDYPDNLQVNVETAVGYNPQSTFKDYISSEKSATDWLGYDNGYRQHDHDKNPTVDLLTAGLYLGKSEQNRYLEFTALGLGDYFNSIGITKDNYAANSEQYTKLALVQLGFLPKALFNDAEAYKKAQLDFLTSGLRQKAYVINNQRFENDNTSFKNNWGNVKRKAPLNFSQTFSVGDNLKISKNSSLGLLVGLRYNSSVVSDKNAIGINYFTSPGGDALNLNAPTTQNVSREVNGWNILLNANYKINKNNSIGVLFMPNITGINNARNSESSTVSLPDGYFAYSRDQFYESRKQFIYQLKSEHYLPGTKIKIALNASYTKGKNDLPDFKRLPFQGKKDPVTGEITQINFGGEGQPIERNFRTLNENVFDSKLALEMPFKSDADGKPIGKIKIGGAYQYNTRFNTRYRYSANFGNGAIDPKLTIDELSSYFDPENFQISYFNGNANGTPYPDAQLFNYYARYNTPVNKTFGKSSVAAAFAMLDYNISKQLRVSGGVRAEQFIALTDVSLFDSLHYKNNDLRRLYVAENMVELLANGAYRNEVNYLPSLNLIYKLNHNDEKPINVRLNYSKTVARPSLRELLDVSYFDYEFNNFVKGNSELKTVKVDNYDLRFESYFKSGENISASVFYKEMINTIQMIYVEALGLSWFNSPEKSYVKGIELEGKKKLTRNLQFMANATFVSSSSAVYNSYKRSQLTGEGNTVVYGDETVRKTLFGQAPYVFNAILSYNSDSLGLTAAISYNIQGPKLSVLAPDQYTYDIYEMPRHLIDFKISKTLTKHFTLSLNIKDLLNSPITRAAKYKEKKGFYKDVYYDKYRYGSIYQLSISYKI
ncbi:MAG TPA: carboxypeptidase-like regulatory domain-containing protein [Bacteroidia bacterium]|nr:carboxypeptidase-like regulatory domain-containing protein [Bacteroidia bacterium]